MKRVLLLGAGVQSTRILMGMEEGEIPRADVAVFADTSWEPQKVYEHLAWLEQTCSIPIARVEQGNLMEDALDSQVLYTKGEKNGSRWASLPYFTRKVWTGADKEELLRLIGEREAAEKSASKYRDILDRVRTQGEFTQDGMIRRQCTYEYKIRPIQRYIRREVLGLKLRQRAPKEPSVTMIFGISFDESQRMRNPEFPAWQVHEYPLVEMRQTRRHCLDWLEARGIDAPRSACKGCPFHSDNEWRAMKLSQPEEFEETCQFDEAIRDTGGMRGKVYLHAQRIPLREVDLRNDEDRGQLPLWQDECHGICGV